MEVMKMVVASSCLFFGIGNDVAVAFAPSSSFHDVIRTGHLSVGRGSGRVSNLWMQRRTFGGGQSFVKGIRLPLVYPPSFSYLEERYQKTIPLPSSHLPTDLATLHTYATEWTEETHLSAIRSAPTTSNDGSFDSCYGHIVSFPDNDDDHESPKLDEPSTWIGAVGCTAQIMALSPVSSFSNNDDTEDDEQELAPVASLTRGGFRFVVKHIVHMEPFVLATVDELLDFPLNDHDHDDTPFDPRTDTTTNVNALSDTKHSNSATTKGSGIIEYSDFGDFEVGDDQGSVIITDSNDLRHMEDDEDGIHVYDSLSTPQLIQRIMKSVKSIVDQRLHSRTKKKLQQDDQQQQQQTDDSTLDEDDAEEKAFMLDTFQSTLFDICSVPNERNFAIAMFAGEMVNLSNRYRRKMLLLRDGIERLKWVLLGIERRMKDDDEEEEQQWYTTKKRVLSKDTVKQRNVVASEEEEDDYLIHAMKPKEVDALPSWTKQIRKGSIIEYFWNEVDGWISGVVMEVPIFVVNEILLIVSFDSDTKDDNEREIHRLPFQANEKARWRPIRL